MATEVVLAQVSKGGRPRSFDRKMRAEIQKVAMPQLDVKTLMAEDEIEKERGIPFRFGYSFEVDYSLENSGNWEKLDDGGRIWRLKIFSEGAYSINLIYSHFWIPDGAELFIYNENRDMVRGAFTSKNNKDHNQFATAPVKGDVSILEYYEPANVTERGIINIAGIVHGYKDIFNYETVKAAGFGSSGSCNINVECPEGDPWQDQIRSVAMILTDGGTRICSGALVNNMRQDGAPYFLTADHCLGSEETWVFMFNYQSPNCNNNDGPTYMTVSGSTLLANYPTSDMAFLLLSEPPPDGYDVYFGGWSVYDIPSQTSVAIHHPRGDVKKIMIYLRKHRLPSIIQEAMSKKSLSRMIRSLLLIISTQKAPLIGELKTGMPGLRKRDRQDRRCSIKTNELLGNCTAGTPRAVIMPPTGMAKCRFHGKEGELHQRESEIISTPTIRACYI
jgi:hypothetical protein